MFNPPENIDSLPPKAARNLALTLSDRVSRFNLQNRFSVHKYFTNVHKYHKIWQKSGAAWDVKQRPSCFCFSSALPCFTKCPKELFLTAALLWQRSVPLVELYSYIRFCTWDFYLYLNPSRKIWDRSFGVCGGKCCVTRGRELNISSRLCVTRRHRYEIGATPGADLNI